MKNYHKALAGIKNQKKMVTCKQKHRLVCYQLTKRTEPQQRTKAYQSYVTGFIVGVAGFASDAFSVVRQHFADQPQNDASGKARV